MAEEKDSASDVNTIVQVFIKDLVSLELNIPVLFAKSKHPKGGVSLQLT